MGSKIRWERLKHILYGKNRGSVRLRRRVKDGMKMGRREIKRWDGVPAACGGDRGQKTNLFVVIEHKERWREVGRQLRGDFVHLYFVHFLLEQVTENLQEEKERQAVGKV